MSPDNNYDSTAGQTGVVIDGKIYNPAASGVDPSTIADTWKFSGDKNITATNCSSYGGEENALDINNGCSDFKFTGIALIGGKAGGQVTKGGCTNMAFTNVVFTPDPAAPYDVEWDGFSDQSRDYSMGTLTNYTRTDGQPVRLVFGRFHSPKIVGGNIKILWGRTIGYHAYNLAKDLARLLWRVPRGVKGPAWFP
jgi:hypothetical protein